MHTTIELDTWTLYRGESTVGETVRVPHDAMLAEPRNAEAPTGPAGSFFPGGLYRYEYLLEVPIEWTDKVVALELEGVYQKACVLVDGIELFHHDYGYTGFTVDLTKHLVPGANSVLTVIADNSHQPNSRWYSGSGMYRPARLHIQDQVHIALEGVQIETISLDPAQVRIQTDVVAADGIAADGCAVALTLKYDGQVVAEGFGLDTVLEVPDAHLWSADEPTLYTCCIELSQAGQVLEERCLSVGIRQISWGSFGLRINGEEILLRGGCLHHTKGILGAADIPEASWREVALLKAYGFNAIRSAHNPISKSMLDACDHLGMFIIDEFADMWYRHKNPADYARGFESCWQSDLTAMIEKDRNHPSVIAYSIGNENAEPAEGRGIDTAQMLAGFVRKLDASRPVTAGVNPTILFASKLGIDSFNAEGEEGVSAAHAGDTNEQSQEANASLIYNTYVAKMGAVMELMSRLPAVGRANAPFFDRLDLAGYNYGTSRYLPDIHRTPNRPVYGSETMPYDLAKNWRQVEKVPQIVGDFMWTAIDYLGECSLAGWSNDPEMVNKPYPWLCADTGALDLIGNPNGEAAMAEVVWGVADPLLYVRPCTLPHPVKAPWRGTNSIPSWSWVGCEGVTTTVEVYTHAPIAKLYLNGRLIGTKRVRDCHADFRLCYEPGRLEALAGAPDGEVLGTTELKSASGDLSLQLTREKLSMPCARGSRQIVFVDVCVADDSAVVEASFDSEVTVSVDGGELIAFGSAAQKSERSYLEGVFPLRYGRGLAVIRLENESCTLTASASGVKPAHLELRP